MRTWLYDKISTHTPLKTIIDAANSSNITLSDHVSQGEVLSDRLFPKPYIYYNIGNRTNQNMGEDVLVYNQFFQVFIHDVPGDYTLIDDLVKELIKLLHQSTGEEGKYQIIRVQFLEASADLDDDTLGTIMRYVRFVAVVKENN